MKQKFITVQKLNKMDELILFFPLKIKDKNRTLFPKLKAVDNE
ncbi:MULTISPECIES: hypothetical protein [Flavobacterium]|nr:MULTISPECIES: hypothetical protein [Flavobacterium]